MRKKDAAAVPLVEQMAPGIRRESAFQDQLFDRMPIALESASRQANQRLPIAFWLHKISVVCGENMSKMGEALDLQSYDLGVVKPDLLVCALNPELQCQRSCVAGHGTQNGLTMIKSANLSGFGTDLSRLVLAF